MELSINKLFFKPPYITTPYHDKIKLLMADATATGRPSPIVEEYIINEILPYYANSHSNAFCATLMSNKIAEVRKYIRKTYNLNDDHMILFSGNGATGAINHLIHSIDFSKYGKINIIITIFEHYSNHLPWMKISRKHKNMNIWYLPINENFEIDLKLLNSFLSNNSSVDILNIVSVTGCSNVTGIKTNLKEVKKILNKYSNNYLFVDGACLAPHEVIDGSLFDALFISGHKFIGGNGTTGILIAKSKLFTKKHPFIPGGGTVEFANSDEIQYYNDLEEKESGGTPNIIGIIKLKKAMETTYAFKDVIKKNDVWITNYVNSFLYKLMKNNTNFDFIFPNVALDHRVPIFCIIISDLSHNDVVLLLNDMFGIQTRGGLSCCGMFADFLRKQMKKTFEGWCRITFSWYMTKKEIDYILNSIKFLVENSKKIKAKPDGMRKALYYLE